MYETGVREREMFALTWNDIDFKSGIIRISKSITSKTKVKGYAVTTPQKRKQHTKHRYFRHAIKTHFRVI